LSDGPEWFAPKRYGYGATPITWQGWALTFGFVVLTIFLSMTLAQRPLELFAILTPLVIAFMVIGAKTTRGGWRWRWGDDD
jgi:amino acid transporter